MQGEKMKLCICCWFKLWQ